MNDTQIERPDEGSRRWRRALAATAAVGALTAGALVTLGGGGTTAVQLAGTSEDISGPCDEAEHANDPRCTGAATDRTRDDDSTSTTAARTSTPTTPTTAGGGSSPAATGAVRTFDAAGAGTVSYEVNGSSVSLVSAIPAPGWRVEVEQAAGDEIDLDFRSGSRRVQVDVEWEDGAPRERVRIRDDADDSDVRTEDGQVVRDDSVSDDDHDDSSEDRSGSNSGSDDGRVDDDHDDDDSGSGSGSGSHDDDDDDRDDADGGDDDSSGRDHPEDD